MQKSPVKWRELTNSDSISWNSVSGTTSARSRERPNCKELRRSANSIKCEKYWFLSAPIYSSRWSTRSSKTNVRLKDLKSSKIVTLIDLRKTSTTECWDLDLIYRLDSDTLSEIASNWELCSLEMSNWREQKIYSAASWSLRVLAKTCMIRWCSGLSLSSIGATKVRWSRRCLNERDTSCPESSSERKSSCSISIKVKRNWRKPCKSCKISNHTILKKYWMTISSASVTNITSAKCTFGSCCNINICAPAPSTSKIGGSFTKIWSCSNRSRMTRMMKVQRKSRLPSRHPSPYTSKRMRVSLF